MAATLPPAGADDVLYIVDILGYIFRSFHGISNPLTSPSGEPTSVTLGTITMLQRLLSDQQPRYIVVAMDSATPTFRHQIDANYKANRPPPPPELRQQILRTREILELYSLPLLQRDGFEADDLIASAVKLARSLGLRSVVVSADKDLMQLVGNDVWLWDTMRNNVFGVEEVKEKWGVPPGQMRDLLSLMGDSSDNVPGVPHIGPKKGAELLAAYGNLDGIFANLTQIKAKAVRQTLTEHEAEARLSQRLVTLRDDLEVGKDTSAFVAGQPDLAKLRTLFRELNFNRLLAALGSDKPAPVPGAPAVVEAPRPAGPRKRAYKAIQSADDLAAFCERARGAPLLAVHVEASHLQTAQAHLIGVALSFDPAEGYYVPVSHDWGLGAPDQVSPEALRQHLGPLLAADTPAKVGHDLKQIEMLLHNEKMTLGATQFDTLLASYLLDPEAEHDIPVLARKELYEPVTSLDMITDKKNKQRSLAQVPLELAMPYAASRPAVILDLIDRLRNKVEGAGMGKLLNEVELPLSRVLVAMEERGVLVDINTLRVIGRDIDVKLTDLEKKAKEAIGKDFNVNSPRQLEGILFDELGLPIVKRTKTGRSTDAEVLEALTQYHPLPGLIVEHRQLAKLKGTYIDALPLLVNTRTRRIHTTLHQAVAATGRLSSSDPNLQNIPIRTEEGRKIRSAFVAPEGAAIVSVDYSQIELRLLAHLSKDPTLLDSFLHGEDIHTRTAAEMFGKPKEEVTPDMRRAAKTINFGVIYGMGDTALAKQLSVTREEAASFIEKYFQRYAGVKTYFEKILEEARGSGSVGTLLGRRRFLPDLTSANRASRLQAERIAQNTPIQGTAADIIKIAMVDLRDPVVEGAHMVLTVHDELLFEVPLGKEKEAGDRAKMLMENVGIKLGLAVPLRADVGHGPSWAAAHG